MRRTFTLVIAMVFVGSLHGQTGVGSPVTGHEHPTMLAVDEAMRAFMEEHKIDGGALAIVNQGRLVYARGFGYADPDAREPVQPDSLFRIASVSKPITAIAIMALVEDGRLSLDDRMMEVLDVEPLVAGNRTPDERLNRITVRDLLEHAGGWDRDRSGDPMFMARRISRAFDSPSPPTCDQIIRYWLGRPLDFDPGARSAYSNFGYCVLGRIIEAQSGMAYEQYVRDRVLSRVGVTRMRIGATLRDRRADGEVTYRDPGGHAGPSVFDEARGSVPAPYGRWCIETMDAHGGWIASAVDLVRIASALDDRDASPILNRASIDELFARPAHVAADEPAYYARGWLVRPAGTSENTWHNGALPGTGAILVRLHHGITWAALFNTEDTADGSFVGSLADPAINRAIFRVREWPEGDLFPEFEGR